MTNEERNFLLNYNQAIISALARRKDLTLPQVAELKSARIVISCLKAEPEAWLREDSQGFHLPMILRKKDGPPVVEAEFYPVYRDAPFHVASEFRGWLVSLPGCPAVFTDNRESLAAILDNDHHPFIVEELFKKPGGES